MKHRSVFIAVLSLLLSIPFFSFSAFGMASEEDEEKKVLYFHVGAPKTGTKAIQYECMERREELAKLGVFYPPPANNVNHAEEIQKVCYGEAEETKEWILKVKAQAKGFKSVFLSEESAALYNGNLRFHEFLTFLNEHFLVNYIYCVREIVPTVGSHLTMNIITGAIIINDEININELIKARLLKRINSYSFYSSLNTTFLSYDELANSGKLVQTFLQKAMGLTIEIPNKSINTMGDYYCGCVTDFTDTELAHLERAFSVEEGSFSPVYRQPNGTLELSKLLSAHIRGRTKKLLSIPKFHMGELSFYPSSGFSAFERSHRWTEGTKASITIPLAEMEPRPFRISFLNTGGFVTDRHTQDLTIKMNGEVVDHYVYTLSNNDHTIDITLPKAGPAEIEFAIPHAISPSELGTGTDDRKLGIAFRDVQLYY